MQLRSFLCVILFVIAYICLIPGLTCLLFSAKAEIFGITMVDLEKSTVGAIRLLFDHGRWPAALTILICSVVAPFLKLAVLLVCVYAMQVRGSSGPVISFAITAVRRISKWATVDAFTALILVAFFTDSSILQVNLHKGFYFFVGYCIFSVAGALVLERPSEENVDEQTRLMASTAPLQKPYSRAALALSVMLAIIILMVLSVVPLFEVKANMISLNERLNFIMIVQHLLKFGSRFAAFLCVACVGIVPAAHLVWITTEVAGGVRSGHPLGEWLQDFAMLEVFALAIVVTQNASAGVNSDLDVKTLWGGWVVVIWSVVCVLYSCALRPQTVSKGVTEVMKEKGVLAA